ncbi:MAG: ferritin-like domain-containing protein [Chthoniobacterales bacterium]|nr:ferritin-like domain-containing protein [Chthoniobacterales bacterium]
MIDRVQEQLTTRLGSTRRDALKKLGLGVAGLAGLNLITGKAEAQATGSLEQDAAILNFALNLEYLEAQYYLYATTGQGLPAQGVSIEGSGEKGFVTIKPTPKVPFETQIIRQYAQEIAADELDHVKFIRAVLEAGGFQPVAQPKIDLLNSFNTLAIAAGIGPSFDPFENEVNFLIGAFIFEDVGVTAYKGAAPLLFNKNVLEAAAGILAVEAYHASEVRTNLSRFDEARPTAGIAGIVQKISDLRDALDSPANKDQGIKRDGKANIVPTNKFGLAFSRNTREVLNIVYGAQGASSGLFFPNGVNGSIQ